MFQNTREAFAPPCPHVHTPSNIAYRAASCSPCVGRASDFNLYLWWAITSRCNLIAIQDVAKSQNENINTKPIFDFSRIGV